MGRGREVLDDLLPAFADQLFHFQVAVIVHGPNAVRLRKGLYPGYHSVCHGVLARERGHEAH
jgi:hypothetical protein